MKNKAILTSIFLALILILSACSSISLPAISASAAQTTSTSSTVQNKLGVGILKLEGSQLAVTTDQAKDLLPLWKALRALGSSSGSSQIEIAALYDQIEETLTAEQLAAIGELTWTQAELDELTVLYSADTTPVAAVTAAASSSSANTSAQSGGPGMDMGGGPGGGSSDLAVISGSSSSVPQTASQATTTSSTKKAASTVTASLNITLSGSVVTLLETISA